MPTESVQEDTRKTFNTAFWNTFANVLSLIIGTVMVPIITRVLDPEELGVASTFIANRNTIVIFAVLCVYTYTNHAMIDFPDNRRGYLKSMSLFCLIAISLAFLVCLPFKAQIMRFLSLDTFLYHWLFVSMFCFALYSMVYCYCVFKNKTGIVFAITLTIGPVSQILSVLLATMLKDHSYIGRVIGLDAVYVISAISLLIWIAFSKKEGGTIERRHYNRTLAFTIPLIPHLLSQMVLTQCDLTMISMLAGTDKSGIYSMGHTIGNLAFTVMTQIMAVWSPWVYRRLAEGTFEAIKHNFKIVIYLGAYLSCGLMTITPEVISLFLPASYAPTGQITAPLVVSMFIQLTYLFMYDIEYFYKKPHWIACASIVTALINVALNFLLIPRVGYLVTCYITLFSYCCLFGVNYLFARKLNVNKVYNVPFLFLSILVVLLYMITMQVFADAAIIRYPLMLLITAVLIITQRTTFKRVLQLVLPTR